MIVDGKVWPEKVEWTNDDELYVEILILSSNNEYVYLNKKEDVIYRLPYYEERKDTFLPQYKEAFRDAKFRQTIEHILNGDI